MLFSVRLLEPLHATIFLNVYLHSAFLFFDYYKKLQNIFAFLCACRGHDLDRSFLLKNPPPARNYYRLLSRWYGLELARARRGISSRNEPSRLRASVAAGIEADLSLPQISAASEAP